MEVLLIKMELITVDAELNLDLVGVPGSSDPANFLSYNSAAASQSGYLFLEL